MSSPYPVLDNRPIDQWKVTELKEELRRRRLTVKGLKEDLIKRLDESIRNERENAEEDVDNGSNCDPQHEVQATDAETVPAVVETDEDIMDHGDNCNNNVDDDVRVDVDDGEMEFDQENVQEEKITGDSISVGVEEVLVVETTVETSVTVTECVVSEIASSGQESQNNETQEENGNSKPQLENEDSKPQLENEDSKPQLENEDSKPQLENEDSKPQLENEDVMLNSSIPTNQVSEVSPVLGFQVKSDSISTDSVSINEKNELKDNIIADNVKLELDVVKLEMVEPLSSNVVPDGGESHPMDDEGPLENKVSVEEIEDNNAKNSELSKKNDNADVGYSEKLNLDRSSGDDSMEEDAMESKQIDSKYNSDEMGDRSEQTEVPIVNEEVAVDVVGDDLSADNKDIHVENKKNAAPTEKRKLHDQEAIGNNEPLKRQRRWNSESLKVPEPQSSTVSLSTTPKDTFQPAIKRNFSRSDSTTSEDTPKERIVPPSPKTPTNSLRIDRFLRPFTLKAVQELLGKTGNVATFWMDHIKTHCYVTYSSVEEAIETRNAVYNLQWPPNGGRLLVAEFVDPQEVKVKVEAPQSPATPVSTGPTVPPAPPALQPQPSPRQQVLRQQLPPPPPMLPPPPPLSNPPPVRERLNHLPPPPPLPEKLDPPIVTLDDLFRKTKATPRIYYLPLSEEQVTAKQAMRGRNTKQ